jgi:hypothetical protein
MLSMKELDKLVKSTNVHVKCKRKANITKGANNM